ncbi:MAG: Bax inhibitor-1/YccA family protein [Gammaproteobacteria bacterium]|nr:Bax inhibitor-1/YccA family protein [Gammaproteobacteria bacterium]
MNPQFQPMATIQASDVSINRVLKNTYMLLGMTMLFSAITAYFSMSINSQPNFILTLVGMFGLLYLTTRLQNSVWGIVSCFAFTGFMGYTIGPVLNMTIHGYSNGAQLIMTSLGSTGLIFLALSAYVITSRRNFTFMGGFLFIAVTAAFLAGIANIFFNLPMLQLIVSGAFAVISSGYILFTTSLIIQGGERNYIMATVSLFVSLFNLFISLLQILSFFAGRRD